MAYHQYTTRAFVLSSRPYREADKLYWLFTEDLGLIRASATGVRLLKSKLRYALSDLSLVSVALVRGKEYWRITSSLNLVSLQTELRTREKTAIYARLFSLVTRLVQGDGEERAIFRVIVSSLSFVRDATDTNTTEAIEFSLVLRILHFLGYVGESSRYPHLSLPEISGEEIEIMKRSRKDALTTINASLKASQL